MAALYSRHGQDPCAGRGRARCGRGVAIPGGRVRVALDGSGTWPRYFFRVTDYDALEADRARQRAQPGSAAGADVPLTRETATDAATPSTPAPAAAPSTPAAHANDEPPAAAGSKAGSWTDFRGPARDGRTESRFAPTGRRRAAAVVEAADRPRLRVVRRRRRPRVHDRAAAQSGSGRPPTTSRPAASCGPTAGTGEFVEVDGRRRSARDADLARAAASTRSARAGELRCLDAATGTLIWRRNILADNDAANLHWGMAGVAADRRRQGDRAAGRARGHDRWSRTHKMHRRAASGRRSTTVRRTRRRCW